VRTTGSAEGAAETIKNKSGGGKATFSVTDRMVALADRTSFAH
jgi:hypothetical protein